jgi:hypothetical protein
MNKIIIGGLVMVAATMIVAATAWNFSAVAEMPEKYVTKEDNTREHTKIENKLDRILDHLIGRDR